METKLQFVKLVMKYMAISALFMNWDAKLVEDSMFELVLKVGILILYRVIEEIVHTVVVGLH